MGSQSFEQIPGMKKKFKNAQVTHPTPVAHCATFVSLVAMLQGCGYVIGEDLFGFSYDWRTSLSSFGLLSLLAARIRFVYEKVLRMGATPAGAKLLVVTHFSGGILLRNVLIHVPEVSDMLHTWVASSTPWQGSSFLFADNMWPLSVTRKKEGAALPSYFADQDFLMGLSKESLAALYATPAAVEMKNGRISDEDFETQSDLESTARNILDGDIIEDAATRSVSALSPIFWRYTPPPLFPVFVVASKKFLPPGWETFPQAFLPNAPMHQILSDPYVLSRVARVLDIPAMTSGPVIHSILGRDKFHPKKIRPKNVLQASTPRSSRNSSAWMSPQHARASIGFRASAQSSPLTGAPEEQFPSPPSKHPIILIPGIGGSQLRMRDRESGIDKGVWLRGFASEKYMENYLWGYYDPASRVFKSFYDRVQVYTRFGSDGLDSIDSLMCDVTGLQPFISKWIVYFGNLTSFLIKEHGFTPGIDLFGLPYDWRQHLSLCAYQLHSLVLRAFHTNGGKKVDLVAHSMGGCLVLAYMRQFPHVWQTYIRRLVTIATPFRGAAGMLTASPLWGYTLKFEIFNPTVFKQLECNSPSIAYLLPPLVAEGPALFLRAKHKRSEPSPGLIDVPGGGADPYGEEQHLSLPQTPARMSQRSSRSDTHLPSTPKARGHVDFTKVNLLDLPPLAEVLLERFAYLPERELGVLRCVLSDPDWRKNLGLISRARLTLRMNKRYSSSIGHRLHFTMGCQGWGEPGILADYAFEDRESRGTSSSSHNSRPVSWDKRSRKEKRKEAKLLKKAQRELRAGAERPPTASSLAFPEPGEVIPPSSLPVLDTNSPPQIIEIEEEAHGRLLEDETVSPWRCYSFRELPRLEKLRYQTHPPAPADACPSSFPPSDLYIAGDTEPMRSAVLQTVRDLIATRAGDGSRPWLHEPGIPKDLLCSSGANELLEAALREDLLEAASDDGPQGARPRGDGRIVPMDMSESAAAAAESSDGAAHARSVPEAHGSLQDLYNVVYPPNTLAHALFQIHPERWNHTLESTCRHILLPVDAGATKLVDATRMKAAEMQTRRLKTPPQVPQIARCTELTQSPEELNFSTIFTEDSLVGPTQTDDHTGSQTRHFIEASGDESSDLLGVAVSPSGSAETSVSESASVELSFSVDVDEGADDEATRSERDDIEMTPEPESSTGASARATGATDTSIDPEVLERPFLFFSIAGSGVPTGYHTFYDKAFGAAPEIPLEKPGFVDVTGDSTVPLVSALADPFPDWYVGARVALEGGTHFGLIQDPRTFAHIAAFLGLA
eukprot:gnl/Chilomastix_cuspidata/665.p1 GENE.gnl/Chilomastix_cuspidata/665~~gnl/Chilomastix_cuspidata/665.p1  ORF type:complete len:1291 (-),score=579.79 gnl/Chilomastix_cuspidata/665:1498-5370(-)